jgi:hypothetical protein
MTYPVITVFDFVLSHVATYMWTIISKQDGSKGERGEDTMLG